MTHFDRQVFRAMVERARHLTDGELAALLEDSDVSAVGRRVLEAESARRAGQQQTIAGA